MSEKVQKVNKRAYDIEYELLEGGVDDSPPRLFPPERFVVGVGGLEGVPTRLLDLRNQLLDLVGREGGSWGAELSPLDEFRERGLQRRREIVPQREKGRLELVSRWVGWSCVLEGSGRGRERRRGGAAEFGKRGEGAVLLLRHRDWRGGLARGAAFWRGAFPRRHDLGQSRK